MNTDIYGSIGLVSIRLGRVRNIRLGGWVKQLNLNDDWMVR